MARRNWTAGLARLPAWPLLLDEPCAALFLSLHPDEFQRAVQLGQVPPPQRVSGQLRWSRPALEACFDPSGSAPVPGFDPIAAAIDAAEL